MFTEYTIVHRAYYRVDDGPLGGTAVEYRYPNMDNAFFLASLLRAALRTDGHSGDVWLEPIDSKLDDQSRLTYHVHHIRRAGRKDLESDWCNYYGPLDFDPDEEPITDDEIRETLFEVIAGDCFMLGIDPEAVGL